MVHSIIPEEVLLTGAKLLDMTVLEAKLNELDKWKKYEVYEEVPDNEPYQCDGYAQKKILKKEKSLKHAWLHVAMIKKTACFEKILQLAPKRVYV